MIDVQVILIENFRCSRSTLALHNSSFIMSQATNEIITRTYICWTLEQRNTSVYVYIYICIYTYVKSEIFFQVCD